ncbi:MAG TPA: ATP synthase F1 subunit epsilon [Planctomycetaceae bacterium]|nr:ATP synthase F1 subunit epsilon [Planctomycetaceae bacterium]
MPALHCYVVTPEQTVRETFADFVAVALDDGELGIAPGRAPLIARLGVGELRITCAGKTERYYIENGFVEVINNVVSLLTERAVAADEIDEFFVQEELDMARGEPAHTPEGMALRDETIRRAREQLRVARRNTR